MTSFEVSAERTGHYVATMRHAGRAFNHFQPSSDGVVGHGLGSTSCPTLAPQEVASRSTQGDAGRSWDRPRHVPTFLIQPAQIRLTSDLGDPGLGAHASIHARLRALPRRRSTGRLDRGPADSAICAGGMPVPCEHDARIRRF